MTATITEATTYTEWGVRRTWPDGHSEVTRFEDRAGAEANARFVNYCRERGEVQDEAEVVTREVTVTDWPVKS